MFKKMSKFIFSMSLAMLACGAGVLCLTGIQNKSKATDVESLSVILDGKTYSLEGNTYGTHTFYRIDSAEDLALVSYMVSVAKNNQWAGYNYELACDINLGSMGWTAIGTLDNPYKGVFNGNGYTIDGLNADKDSCESSLFYDGDDSMISPVIGAYYNNAGTYYQFQENKGYVLVASLPDGATATDVNVQHSYFYGLFGYVEGAEFADIVMGSGCYVYSDDVEGSYSGILVAKTKEATFHNVYDAAADVRAEYSAVSSEYVTTKDTEINANKAYYTQAVSYAAVSNPSQFAFEAGIYFLEEEAGVYVDAHTKLSGIYDSSLTYYVVKYEYKQVTTPAVADISSYYERVHKINAGANTYYYLQTNSGTLTLYSEAQLTNKVVEFEYEIGKTGSFIAGNRAYYFDYIPSSGQLVLNLKTRYIVNSVTTDANTITVAGTTYYLNTATEGQMTLHTTAAFTDTAILNVEGDGSGEVTLGGKTYPYSYRNAVLRILSNSEVCTVGFASTQDEFYKGNYYRLSEAQYIGVGAVSEGKSYDGAINVLGTTYYYVYSEENGNSQIALYTDAEYGYPDYIGRGDAYGIGSISILGNDFVFNYEKSSKDLYLSIVNNYITNIPYTIEEIESNKALSDLEKGAVISFNVENPEKNNRATFYKKGSDETLSRFSMLYNYTTGLKTLDYNNGFSASNVTLPTSYELVTDGNYYVLNNYRLGDTSGYIFEYWAVPNVKDGYEIGEETIVYSDANGLRSYIPTADELAQADKTYYSYEFGIFLSKSVEEGASVAGLYEQLDADATISNIISNDYQVNAVWTAKNYTLNVDINGAAKTITMGYGANWDDVVSQLTRDGYDLTGIYYDADAYTVSGVDGEVIYGYSLNYEYDNYGNVSNFSYLKTNDEAIVEGKEYYIYSAGAFAKVESPAVADIASYYEKALNVALYGAKLEDGASGNTRLLDWETDATNIYLYTTWKVRPVNGVIKFTNTTDGVIDDKYSLTIGADSGVKTPISVGENNDYYFALDDNSDIFTVPFTLSTGYELNYIVPAETGSFAMTDIDYYVWDTINSTLSHTYYDSASSAIVESNVDSLRKTGTYNSSTSFTVDGVEYIAGDATNPLSTENYYFDTNKVYVFDGTALVEKLTVIKNGSGYIYTQSRFTENSYRLYIDIAREEYQLKLTVNQEAEITGGTMTFYIYEDGTLVQTIENVGTLADGDEPYYATIKYGSDYVIRGVPATGYAVNTVEGTDISLTQKVAFGNVVISGEVEGVGSAPEYVFTLKTASFTAIADYDYGTDGKYDSSLTSVENLTTNIQSGEGAVQSLTDSSNLTINLCGTSATVSIVNNAYYSVYSLGYYVYSMAYEGVSCTVTIKSKPSDYFYEISIPAGTTVLVYSDESITTQSISGSYYVLASDLVAISGTEQFQILNAPIYSSAQAAVTLSPANKEISGIKNNDVIVLEPRVSKVDYSISKTIYATMGLGLYGLDGTKYDTSTGDVISGPGTKNFFELGNSYSIKNEAGEEITSYHYGDTLTFTANIDSSSNYIYSVSLYGKYVDNDVTHYNQYMYAPYANYKLTENVTIDSCTQGKSNGTESVTICFTMNKAFVPHGIELQLQPSEIIVNAKEDNDAFILNMDGTGDDYLYSITSHVIDINNSTLSTRAGGYSISSNTQKFNIVYSLPVNSPYKLAGWAVYDSIGGTATQIYDYGTDTYGATTESADVTTEFEVSYYDLFTNISADNLSLLEDHVDGIKNLYLIPALEQKKVSIKLTAGEGNGDNIETTAYVGGAAFDMSEYIGNSVNGFSEGGSFSKEGCGAYAWKIEELDHTFKDEDIYSVGRGYSINLNNILGIEDYYDSANVLTFTRLYKPRTYKIYFSADDDVTLDTTGITVETDLDDERKYISVKYDSAYSLPVASKAGYTYENKWAYVGANGETCYLDGSAYTILGDVSVTPVLTANGYNVAFFTNNGTNFEGEENVYKTVLINYDTNPVDSAPTISWEGHDFLGWYVLDADAENGGVLWDGYNLNDSTISKYITLNDNGVPVLHLYAGWTTTEYSTEGYGANHLPPMYSDGGANAVGIRYLYENDSFVIWNGSLFNGEFDATTKTLTLKSGEKLIYKLYYSQSQNGDFVESNKTFDHAKIYGLEVADTGYYKFELSLNDGMTYRFDGATNEFILGVDSSGVPDCYIEILPFMPSETRIFRVDGTYNGTKAPDLRVVKYTGGFFTYESAYDYINAQLLDAMECTAYEVGTVTNSDLTTFVAGKDAGTYNAIKFYWKFKEGVEVNTKNYVLNPTDTEGIYYTIFQLGEVGTSPVRPININVSALDVELTPVVSKIVYTGGAQTIVFTAAATIGGEKFTFEAQGVLKEGSYGSVDETITITSLADALENWSITKIPAGEPTDENGNYINYNFTLGGSLEIISKNESDESIYAYSLVGRLATKESSDATSLELSWINNQLKINGFTITADEARTITGIWGLNMADGYQATLGDFKVYDMAGVTYVFYVEEDGSETLYFQFQNNVAEISIYSVYELSSVEFSEACARHTDNNGAEYALFCLSRPDDFSRNANSGLNAGSDSLKYNLLSGEYEYYAGYTDLVCVNTNYINKLIFSVKVGSEYTAGLTNTGYTFAGYSLEDGETRVTLSEDRKSFTIESLDTYLSVEKVPVLQANWSVSAPDIDATKVRTVLDDYAQSEVTVKVGVSEVLGNYETSITNYSSSIKYFFAVYDPISKKWKNSYNSGDSAVSVAEALTDTSLLPFPYRTNYNSEGYILRIYAKTTSDQTLSTYTDIEFEVSFKLGTTSFVTSETKIIKEGNNESLTTPKTLADVEDKTFVVVYSFGHDYISDVYASIYNNDLASTELEPTTLGDFLALGSTLLTIEMVKNGSGQDITPVLATSFNLAGTYRIKLNDIEYYSTASENQCFYVKVEPYAYEFNDTNLRTLLGTTSAEVFEKVSGGNNSVLSKTIYVTAGNVFGTTAPADGGEYVLLSLAFHGEAGSGLGSGEAGTSLSAGTYDITGVACENANYSFSVSSSDVPQLLVTQNESHVLYITLGDAITYTYDSTTITEARLEWSSERTEYVINGYLADGTLKATWAFSSIKAGEIGNEIEYAFNVNGDFILNNYAIALNTNIRNAGSYSTEVLTITAGEGAVYTSAQFVLTSILTIEKRVITIESVVTEYSYGTRYYSTEEWCNVTGTGLISGDDIYVWGHYPGIGIGTFTVTANISGTDATNYTLSTPNPTGVRIPNTGLVTILPKVNKSQYGSICKTSTDIDLKMLFNYNASVSGGAMDGESIYIGGGLILYSHTITHADGTALTDDDYSTGGYLKYNENGYKVSVTATSECFSNIINPDPFVFMINKKTLNLNTELVIEKDYEMPDFKSVRIGDQVVVTGELAGDIVRVSGEYASGSVGEQDVTFSLSSGDADNDNYELDITTLKGVINPCEVEVKLKVGKATDFVDGQAATLEGVALDDYGEVKLTLEYSDVAEPSEIMEFFSVPIKEGYRFLGWYGGDGRITEETVHKDIQSHLLSQHSFPDYYPYMIIEAKWEKETHTLTIDRSQNTSIEIGGETNSSYMFGYYDEVVFTPGANPGYSYTVVVCKTSDNSVKVTMTSATSFAMPAYDATIKITETKTTYNIWYDSNDYTFEAGAVVPESHTYGTATLVPNPIKTGYTFEGWKVNGALTKIKNLTLGAEDYTSDISLEAAWTANKYTIYIDLAEGETIDESIISAFNKVEDDTSEYYGMYYVEATYDAQVNLPALINKSGYDFQNAWVYGDPETTLDTSAYKVAGDIVVKPVFEAGVYTIKFVKDIEIYSRVSLTISEEPFDESDYLSMKNPIYASWVDDGQGHDVFTTSLTGDKKYGFWIATGDATRHVAPFTFRGKTYGWSDKWEKIVIHDISFVQNETIEMPSAEPHVATITISTKDLDYLDKITFAIKDSEGNDRELKVVENGFSFEFVADEELSIQTIVAKGYEIESYTYENVINYIHLDDKGNGLYSYYGRFFMCGQNYPITFNVIPSTYDATIKIDANKKVSDVIFVGNSSATEVEGEKWTTSLTTGDSLGFSPVVEASHRFIGISLKVENSSATIAIGENKENILESGINISISADGLVTVTGFAEAFEITLITEIRCNTIKIEKIVIGADGKKNTSMQVSVKVNGNEYLEPVEIPFGGEIKLTTEPISEGCDFVGWFASVEISDEGVITYGTANSYNTSFTLTMANNQIAYYAVYEISKVNTSLQVVTNDDLTNKKGGQITNEGGELINSDANVYGTDVLYIASASQGYKFAGWYYIDGEGNEQDASTNVSFDITTLDQDASLNVISSSIEFSVTDDLTIYAKFEAKQLTMDMRTGLLMKGVLTYPNESEDEADHVDYGKVEWGTFLDGVFTVDSTNGTGSKIHTRTDDVAYVKITASEGFFVGQITNTATPFLAEKVASSSVYNYEIYKLSEMNADLGSYSFTISFYSSETNITINYTKDGKLIEGGHTDVIKTKGVSIVGNRTSNVVITASTASSLSVRAYTRLGYGFDTVTDVNSPNYGKIKFTLSGEYRGEIYVTFEQVKEVDRSLGYTYVAIVKIEGYSGGTLNISFGVKADPYNIRLHSSDGKLLTTIQGVSGGEKFELSATNKAAIANMPKIEGYTLKGFYPYINGSGVMYLDAKGECLAPLNDNGYYWNGTEYVMAPYYTEAGGVGIFSLFAVYTIDKTAITIIASPNDLKTIAPTVAASVVIGNLNDANSWTIESDEFYAEVLHGAKVSAKAPRFEGYKFAFWKIERVTRAGDVIIRFNVNEELEDVGHSGYASMTMTAVYYVETQVASTDGGSTIVTGYEYSISADGKTTSRLEKNVSDRYYLSSLDAITYKADPMNGYTFQGWFDEEGELVSTSLVYEVSPSNSKPIYLKAMYVGESKTIRIKDENSQVGNIVKVAKLDENMEEVEISNWSEFSAAVGEKIVIYVNIPSIEYEAVWSGGYVENEISDTYRKYLYTVNAEDELTSEADVIKLSISYQSRQFGFTVNIDLIDKQNSGELNYAGGVVYNNNEIANGYASTTAYGRMIQFNINANKNYKLASILINGEEVADDATLFNGITLKIQTISYDYENVKSIDVQIKFKRDLWIDYVSSSYALNGKGTEESPYKITCEEDLAFVAYMVNVMGDGHYASAHYDLLADLDMTGRYWSPIGITANPFTGTFNFNVYQITNVTVLYGYSGSTSWGGVFGVTFYSNIYKTESNIVLILGIVGIVVLLIGIGVGVYFAGRAKKQKNIEKLAND